MKSKKLVCSACGWETPELRELYSRFQEAVGDAQRFHEQNNKLKKAFDDNLRDYNKALGRIKELEKKIQCVPYEKPVPPRNCCYSGDTCALEVCEDIIKELELAVVQAGIYGDRKLIECAEKDKKIEELEAVKDQLLNELNGLKIHLAECIPLSEVHDAKIYLKEIADLKARINDAIAVAPSDDNSWIQLNEGVGAMLKALRGEKK